jgi:tetratricopeptide (TPR) repeat protein
MTRLAAPFLALLLAGEAAASDFDPLIVEFHLRAESNRVTRGWLTDLDQEGFVFERFGARRPVRHAWTDLVDADARRLRKRFRLDAGAGEELALVSGHRIHFKGGGQLEGLLERVDGRGMHWVRHDGLLLPYPKDRIERIEEIRLEEESVFDKEELYLRHLNAVRPVTATQHRKLADQLHRIGNYEEARYHYRLAINLDSRFQWELRGRLDEIERALADQESNAELRRARRLFALNGKLDEAKAILMRLMENDPRLARQATELVKEIDAEKRSRIVRRFHAVKDEEFKRVIREYLRLKRPTLQEATSWALSGLPAELRARIGERLDLDEDQVAELEPTRTTGMPHWTHYWSGSFTVSSRAKLGKSTNRRIRGDPEEWWNRNPGLTGRTAFLSAFAVERLPDLFEVVRVRFENCSRCGGRGVITRAAFDAARTAGHEWKQLCPRCFGAKRDRIVAYR